MNKKEDSYSEDTIDLRTIFQLFLKRKWWFIGTVLIVMVLGMLYILSKPVIYEVKYKFSFEDDFLPDDYLAYSDSQKLYSNESVFIQVRDVGLIFESDIIFRSLNNIDEIGDDYSDYIHSSLQDLDLENDTGIFSLKVKDTDKELADEIARNLIESLGIQVMNNDLEIYDNTLTMLVEDISALEEKNASYAEKIIFVEEEIQEMHPVLDEIDYNIIEKKGEILLYRTKIIDNEYEIIELKELHQRFSNEKAMVHNRVKIITTDPGYNIENDRVINSIIVILLSLLTGIIVVLAVNYIYKLKEENLKR